MFFISQWSTLKEAVKAFIQNALPNLDDAATCEVTDIIIDGQPNELQDLIYFTEDDFLAKLTKMQARKLLAHIKESFSKGKVFINYKNVLSV